MEADFSKLEIVLLAYEAKDEQLMRYFTVEKNGYIAIGTKLFCKPVEEGTSEYRQIKAVVLGINYGLQVYGLARQLWDIHNVRLSYNYEDHVDRVGQLREKYLRMFPKLVAYQNERKREVHQYGNVETWFGQLRRLPIPVQPARSEGKEVFKKWRRHVAHLENEALNARIQTAASYVTGLAMLDLESVLLQEYRLTHVEFHRALADNKSHELNMPILINEIHDALLVDSPTHCSKKAQNIMKDCMENSKTLHRLMPEFDVPLRVSFTVGGHWGAK